jgi:hypothetical protein
VVINGYYINGYWWLFHYKPLMVILLMAINGYSIGGYKWLLMAILMVIGGYYWLLLVIICYITTIDDYSIIKLLLDILCYNIIGYW